MYGLEGFAFALRCESVSGQGGYIKKALERNSIKGFFSGYWIKFLDFLILFAATNITILTISEKTEPPKEPPVKRPIIAAMTPMIANIHARYSCVKLAGSYEHHSAKNNENDSADN